MATPQRNRPPYHFATLDLEIKLARLRRQASELALARLRLEAEDSPTLALVVEMIDAGEVEIIDVVDGEPLIYAVPGEAA
jgi:hypothetical protein